MAAAIISNSFQKKDGLSHITLCVMKVGQSEKKKRNINNSKCGRLYRSSPLPEFRSEFAADLYKRLRL